MGSQFSSGFVPSELRQHVERPLARVKVLFDAFKRLCRDEFQNNGMFITRDQFQRVFDMDVDEAHRHFGYWDRARRGRVSSVELWGAMALCCAEREEVKINFCFCELLDLDKDGALNEVELRLLLASVSTGVARLKQIRAPPPDLIDSVVQAAFEQAIKTEDELALQGKMDLYNFGMYLKGDDELQKYLASLEREDSGDSEELYKQQADLLLELSKLDTRLDEIDDERARAEHDKQLYEDERGGDVRKELVVGLRGLYDEASSDDEVEVLLGDGEARLASAARKKAKLSGRAMVIESEKTFVTTGEPVQIENRLLAKEYASKQTTTYYKNEAKRRKALERERALKVEGGLAYSKNRKEKQEAPTSPPRQASKLNAQMERRARRKKALGPRAGDDGGDIFKRLARKPAKALVGSDKDDKEKAMLLHKWRTFDQGIDELVRLDIDLFEDLFEALAVFITDDEAEAALRDMPCNSVGAYSLDAVLQWHRNRHASEPTGNEAIRAAKTKLETIKDWVNKAGSTLRRWSTNVRSRLAAKREEMAARAVVAVEEEDSEEDESDSDESEADTATTASQSVKLPVIEGPQEVVPGLRGQAPQATFDDPKQLVSPAKSEQSYKPEPTQPCAGNASLKIGEGDDPKIQEPKASLKFALLRTSRPQLGLGGRSGPDALNDAIDQGLNDTRKLDVSAAELISVDYRRALQAFQGEPASAKEQKSPVKQQRPTTAASPRRPRTGIDEWDPNGPEPARSVFWVDLPIDKDVSVEKVVAVSREIEATARIIPRDYAKQYFDRVRCDVVVAQLPMKSKGKRKGVSGQKVEKPVLRVQVFSRHDPLQIVESSLPEDARPSQVLGTITGVCDFNHTLAELAHEAAKYHDLAPRLWGPQENELGERADPTSFRERIRLLRKKLHDDAESVDAMDQNELRDRLEQEGHASTGAFARGRTADGKEKQPGKVARERLRAVLYRKAARLGYGELSDFGSKVAASIFRRFDPDKSGGMDFDEFAAMSRELGELAPLDSAEYKKSLSASDVHLKTEEHVDPNTHMKRVKVMGVSVEGFVARYARKGSLGTDAALLGCGSLDDQIQLISSMQLELDADAAGRVEAALVAHARTMHQDRIRSWWPLRTFFPQPSQQRRAALLEWLAFFLKFSKGCFIERTASRLSDVLGKDTAPDWLTSPGYLFYAIHQLRETLARGDEGIIPLFRNALQAQFGGRWTSLHEDLGSLHETVPVKEMVEDPLGVQKQLAEDDQVFNAMAGVAGVGRFDSRREKVQDLTGFSHVNVMRVAAKASDIQLRGIPEPTEEEQERMKEQAEIRAAQAAISPAKSTTSQASDLGEEHDVSLYDEAFERLLLGEEKFPPPPDEDDVVVVGGLSANDPTAEEAQAEEKEESLRAHGSNPFCDEGALLHCSHLQTEVDDCESALQRENIPPYARESLERRRDARIRELACYNEAFERREVLALARALRSYDGLRDIAAGPCAFGFGTHTRTIRGELDGFLDTVRLGRLLPAGMGEAAALELHEAQEKRRATDRLLEAQRRILHEKELMRKAAEIAAQRAITAEKRRVRRRFVEEVRLYGRGEKYMREALFYATKYGPTDSVADRKRLEAEELWAKLIKVRKERRGDVSVAHAVCVSNLAVLVAIRGRANKSMLQLQEAVEQAQFAIGLAERALEDRIRAEAASTKCLFEIYHQNLLDWDKAFAILATNEAKQDSKRQAKISLLEREQTQLQKEETEDEDRVAIIEDRLKSLAKSLESMTQQRWNSKFETDAFTKTKPERPLIEVERHEDAMLVLAVCIANELLIIEDIGPPPDSQEDLRRNVLWRQCVALYACASERGRSQLDNLNRRFARLRDENYMPDAMPSSSDEDDSDNESDESVAPEPGDLFVDTSPLEDLWYERHAEDDPVPPLNILGCGVEIGGFFPPPSPQAIRQEMEAKVIAKEQEKETKKQEVLQEKERNRKTEAKMRRMRRQMSMITDFDEETLRKLEKVDPKRAARIRANIERERTLEMKRLRNLEKEERRRLRKEREMMSPTASIDPCSPVQSKEAVACQRQIEYIRELKESKKSKKEIKKATEHLKELQEVHKEVHGKLYDEWVRFRGSYWENVPGRSNTPTLDRAIERVLGRKRGSMGERPEALQKAQDRGSDMRRSSFEDNRDKIFGRPTRLLRPEPSFARKQSARKDLVNYEKPSLKKPSTLLPSLSRADKYAIALHTGHDRPQKRIPPSLFSRVVKKLPSLLPRAPCAKMDSVEDEASVDWIGEALRPPSAPVDGEVVGEDEALSPTPSTPEEYLPLSDAAVWKFQAPAPAPAPAPGRATYTPGRVTWGHEVSFGNEMGATPETPKRHIFFEPRSPTDTDGAFSPTPSMADRPGTGARPWTGAGTPTPSMSFSPSGDMYAAPAPAYYTPGRTPGTPGVRWSDDIRGATPTPSMAYSRAATPGTPTPSMADRPLTGATPRFSPSHDDLYAAPAPAHTPGRTPGTPGVRWSDDVPGASFGASDIRGGTPTPSMAYSRAATPGTPTPSMACSPDEMQDDDDDSMATAAQAVQEDSPPWRTLDDDEGAFSPTPSMADRPEPVTGGAPPEPDGKGM